MIRTYLDWLTGLPVGRRLDGQPRPRAGPEDPRRGPLRPREGQGADPRVPRRPEARARLEGADPLLRRPARRRQDLARPLDRARPRPEVRAALARRRPRRGRDPRPPPDVRRRAARADHPGPLAGRHVEPGLHARRGRQDRRRLPRRPVVGAPRGPRPGAEQDLPRPLPRRELRPLEGPLHHDGERPRHDPARLPRPDGGDPALGLHARGEARDRAAPPDPEAAEGERPPRGRRRLHATPRSGRSSRTTRARRASGTSSARSARCCRKVAVRMRRGRRSSPST